MKRADFILKNDLENLIFWEIQNQKSKYADQISEKECEPQYCLHSVDFNLNTRTAKIEITQSQYYRTVDKYVTRNYIKYPVYSEWKTKSKTIKKSIKLTNQALENLHMNGDNLIRSFANQIIYKLNAPDLYPSWFLKKFLRKRYESRILELDKSCKNVEVANLEKIDFIKNKTIFLLNAELSKIQKKLLRKTQKRLKLQEKVKKIESAKKSFLKNIFSLFIYNYLISNKRKKKIENKIINLDTIIDIMNKEIISIEKKITTKNNEILSLQEEIEVKKEKTKNLKQIELDLCSKLILQVLPLPENLTEVNGFIPLKTFVGYENKKIVGCYIIKNKEKEKYYVGQSKDVYKRLKQHFSGTIPKNSIFAEDYYLSTFANKDDIFEIKIIECETKDELDLTEKELIDKYDSYKSGYNGTSGNK